MAKVVCVLYDDPINGHPRTYARDALPALERSAEAERFKKSDAPR